MQICTASSSIKSSYVVHLYLVGGFLTWDCHFAEFTYVGLWAILGILTFVVLEKLAHAYGDGGDEEEEEEESDEDTTQSDESPNGTPSTTAEVPSRESSRQLRSHSAKKKARETPSMIGSTSGRRLTARRSSSTDQRAKKVSLPTMPDTLKVRR